MAKKLVIAGPHAVDYINVQIGPPAQGEVVARSLISGISHGTEMTAFLGTNPFVTSTISPHRTFVPRDSAQESFYPFHWAGYELVGEVTAVGTGVTRFEPGDLVWHNTPHQSEFVFNENDGNAIKVRPGMALEPLTLLNLTSIAYGAVLDAEIKLGDVVVVSGGGIVGQMAVQLAFLSGARKVFLAEPEAERRAFAAERSAVETFDPRDEDAAFTLLRNSGTSQAPDVVLECSGAVAGLRGALRLAGIAGRVVAAGFYAGPATGLCLGEEFLHNRINLIPSMWVWGCPSRWPERWSRERVLHESYHLLESGRLNTEGFVTTRFPFTEARQAYEAIHSDPARHLKVVLTY